MITLGIGAGLALIGITSMLYTLKLKRQIVTKEKELILSKKSDSA